MREGWLLAASMLISCGGSSAPAAPTTDAGRLDGGADVASEAAIDGASDAPDPNRIRIPEQAPLDAWTWIDVPEARCANDTATGLAINPTNKSKKLLVFLDGGGVCWSDDHCLALHLDGYGAKDFSGFIASAKGMLDRTDATNPLRDASMVFLPYCTGDLHWGDHVATYPSHGVLHHVGFANYGAFLKRIVATFPDVDSVVLAGISAGGAGATWNYARTHDAFAPKRVYLAADSGAFLEPPYYSTTIAQGRWDAWGLAATVPKGCAKCEPTDGFWNLLPFLDAKYADFRGSNLDSRSDATLGTFLDLDEPTVTTALSQIEAATTTAHFKYFFVSGTQHGFVLDRSLSAITTGATSYATFLEQELRDDPAWKNVDP